MPILPIWPNFEVNGLDWQCCLAGSSKMATRIFIFSIVLGVENLSYVKSIKTHALAFLPLNISAVGSVTWLSNCGMPGAPLGLPGFPTPAPL